MTTSGDQRVKDHDQIFLSYSRNDLETATKLRGQLEQHGLSVFKDDKSIREGDLWLNRLQEAVDICTGFVVLVGRDGVGRWIGAETQTALSRYFGPHDDAERLPIFPILLGDAGPESLPAFLRLFQATPWNGRAPLSERVFQQIRERTIVAGDSAVFEGCPFVGLDAFRMDQARLFFGRQKDTLDALTCFDTRPGSPPVRWLEISGNSGSGKSSLMNAGLLPLVDQGWLWSRTGFAHWLRIGPMMPGQHPVGMLAESLVRFSRDVLREPTEMASVRPLLESDDRALADWLRSRKQENTAFLLAVDQFEELFTFADHNERKRFDRLLSLALADADCPLFVISTVRADFLDRFEDLPRLINLRNRLARPWTLPLIGEDALREIIDGPARLAGLNVSEVQEAVVAEARDEPGALPLVENALSWLWDEREENRLMGQKYTDQGGLAGILSGSADDLLHRLSKTEYERALELLFRLVRADPEGRRHTRRRIPLDEAIAVAGGGEQGRALVNLLAGERDLDHGQAQDLLRLITITEETTGADGPEPNGRWVNLIHETLIRSKGLDEKGEPQAYWPTLWGYIEAYKDRAERREQLRADARTWLEHAKSPSYLWSHERVRELVVALRTPGPSLSLTKEEVEFLGPIDCDAMLVELKQPETTHKCRALIGERLNALGDPRPGVGIDADTGMPDIDWCKVSGGHTSIEIAWRLLRGTTEREFLGPIDPDAMLKELDQGEQLDALDDIRYGVDVDEGYGGHTNIEVAWRFLRGTKLLHKQLGDFRIARYPVTVSQYRAFLDAEDGWDKPCWWEAPDERDPEGKNYDFGRFGNHPAVYVSWFEAMAFCRWLSERLDADVRLPNEWEWQHAAMAGDSANVFPWGQDWDPKEKPFRANTFESQLRAATAVGMYPAGASPAGVLDMAGTVWEWCLNTPKSSRINDKNRVLRGGSWYPHVSPPWSTNRRWFYSALRFDYVGFRVLCASDNLVEK